MIGHFSRDPEYFAVSIPPKMIAPEWLARIEERGGRLTIWRFPTSQVEGESTAVGDLLLGKSVNDGGVTSQLNTGTNTHQSHWEIIG